MDSSTNWWRPPEQARPETEAHPVTDSGSLDLAFWALIAFTTIMLLAPQERFPVLGPFRLAMVSVGVAVVACVYKRTTSGRPIIEFSPDVLLLLLLVAWTIVTLPFSMWPGGSLDELTGRFLKSAVCFLLLSHALTNVRQLWGITWCLVLCALPLSMTGVGNWVGGVYLERGGRIIGYDSGLTGNPNDMALMLNLILPLCVALFLGSRNIVTRLFLGALSGLVVAAIIVTFSRAGFVMLVVIAVTYAWRLRKRPQRIWIPIILALGMFALPLVPADFYDRVRTIVNYEEDQTGSAQTRLSDMKVATRLALSNPIKGAGLGMNILAMNEERGDTWKVIHNLYLQVALDLGFVGLFLYLGLMIQSLRSTGGIVRHGPGEPPPERLVLIAEALRVSLLAFAVAVMFYPVAYNFYFFYYAGLAIAAGRIAQGGTAEGRS